MGEKGRTKETWLSLTLHQEQCSQQWQAAKRLLWRVLIEVLGGAVGRDKQYFAIVGSCKFLY